MSENEEEVQWLDCATTMNYHLDAPRLHFICDSRGYYYWVRAHADVAGDYVAYDDRGYYIGVDRRPTFPIRVCEPVDGLRNVAKLALDNRAAFANSIGNGVGHAMAHLKRVSHGYSIIAPIYVPPKARELRKLREAYAELGSQIKSLESEVLHGK